jgi:hypothetical protein
LAAILQPIESLRMIKAFTCALLLFSSDFLFSQHQSTFRADKDTLAEKQIIQLEFLLTDLITMGDVETYATYLTDDYIRVAANGVISTKEQVLEGLEI